MEIFLLAVLIWAKWILASSASPPANGVVQQAPVLDMQGRELRARVQYYVLPSDNYSGGGLVLSRRDLMCPMNVAQVNSSEFNGMPLTFLPFNNSETAILEGWSKVRIVFSEVTICVQSTAWRIGEVDRTTGRRYVTTGLEARGVPYWFRIERISDGGGYKIVSCPVVCEACNMVCGNIGILSEQGKRWLALSQDPLTVVFKRL